MRWCAGVGQLSRVSKLPRTLRVLRLLKFTRILRVLHLNSYFNRLSSFLVLRPAASRIVVSMFWAFILTHLIACLWCVSFVVPVLVLLLLLVLLLPRQ